MRILYAIQGTGNGHLGRASEIIPSLQKYGDVDIMVSGNNSEIKLPYPINYQLSGLSFKFGKYGNINFIKTILEADLRRLWKEINYLPIKDYDLVVNDFEPISAWAALFKNVPCFGLSHQSAVANKKSPKPKNLDLAGQLILKIYAPAKQKYGFHFKAYDYNIFTPVVRKEIRLCTITNQGHYTVYLPSYGEEIIYRKLSKYESIKWEVFSKHCKEPYQIKNVTFKPVKNSEFIKSLASCAGVLCGAGFETPSEALYLGKKLLVVPMKSQYEQLCNASSLKLMGIPVIKNFNKKGLRIIDNWLNEDTQVKVNYPDITDLIVDSIMENFFYKQPYIVLNHLLEL
jgi:uncharacterized protein (TIGR00661 family)